MALPKLFERIFFRNNTTPALNEDNLNAMSKGIDDIDNRVVELGGKVLEVVPQIEDYLAQADDLVEAMEALSTHPAYIGANGNWWVWSTATSEYIDSGIDASITVNIADITMLPYIDEPYVTNTGTNTDPIFHLFIPRAATIASVTKTGTSGQVDTYTMTLQDGSTFNFTVTNGNGSGDMKAVDYDPTDSVVGAGGIPDFVEDYSETFLENTLKGNIITGVGHSVGTQSTAYPIHAEGTGTTISANAYNAHTEGYNTTVNGSYAHAEGRNTVAAGSASHTEGYSSYAGGYCTHAEGSGSCAIANYAHVEGRNTYVTAAAAEAAHAEGYNSFANGSYSHAEGNSTVASGSGAHSEGTRTTASGSYSHAEGSGSVAGNSYSHAQGVLGKTVGKYEFEAYESNNRKSYDGGNITFAHGTSNPKPTGTGYYDHVIDKSSNNAFSIDERGNFFSTGAHTMMGGYIDGTLVAMGPEIQLEDGACYLLYVNGRDKNTGAWRGAQTFVIDATFHPLGTGATATAQGVPHIQTLGSVGTTPVSLSARVLNTGAAGANSYHSVLGIGSCTTAIGVRWNLVKVLGSVEDFAFGKNV